MLDFPLHSVHSLSGSLIADTADAKNVERVIAPVRDLFAAVFFVSIGILFDPQVVYSKSRNRMRSARSCFFGKMFAVTIGSLLASKNIS